MVGRQAGFWDVEHRLRQLSERGDPLEKLAATVDFEIFRAELVAALGPRDRAKGGRPPFDPVLKFRMLVLQAMHGLSLAQALGRIGGLRDDRADIRGVFIFRLEDPDAVSPQLAQTAKRTADNRIPVVYRFNMSQGTAFFAAQNFQVHNHDVIYVSNAPLVDLQKFLNTLSSAAFSVIGIGNAIK